MKQPDTIDTILDNYFLDIKAYSGNLTLENEAQQEAKQALTEYIEQREIKARIDELGAVQNVYGYQAAQTFINTVPISIENRYEQLKSQLKGSKQ